MERPVYATLRRGKHRRVRAFHGESSNRTGISDESRSERARAANEFRPVPTGHKSRGAVSGAPRKNRTWETRRLARPIRDVAFASRREFVAEARPRSGSGDRLTWTQLSARQAQLFRQTTWRIRSLEIAAKEMTTESGLATGRVRPIGGPDWRSEP